MTCPPIPVVEVGGAHVSAALIDPIAGTIVGTAWRRDLDGSASATRIVDALISAAVELPAPSGAAWGVAIPGPFDYARGVAHFANVGKFDSLRGLDIGAILVARLPGRPRRVDFLNDADAFTLGEWAYGAGAGCQRCVGLTLGTGVGTGWLVNGRITASGVGVPCGGRIHRLEIDGGPLEDTVSSRAIRRAYCDSTGDAIADVQEICGRARRGEPAARRVLRHSLHAMGAVLEPYTRMFAADVVVIGGSIAASWDVWGEWFSAGFTDAADPPLIRLATNSRHAPLLGAAHYVHESAG